MLSGHNLGPRVTRGFRSGIVLGLVIAALGIAVGTATGATTPFQQVIVVNPPASPIPVVGTVNVGNTPSNQNVTVTNLPATQPVSGTVSTVANTVTKAYWDLANVDAGDSFNFVVPGGGMNVTYLRVSDSAATSEAVDVSVLLSSGDSTSIYDGDTPYTNNFTFPVPITKLIVQCRNIVSSCYVDIYMLGY